ncbi:MAG: DNA methyltransferase [Leptospiraceae bacterium]|nr:DNA methyltransferase [Leptospiraceae bacterium]
MRLYLTMSEMKSDVLRIVSAIPEGQVTTYGSIARFLTISPRTVAYLLAGSGNEIPWHRVVSAGGWLNRDRKVGDRKQERKLKAEGITVIGQRVNLEDYGVDARNIQSGVVGGRIYNPESRKRK